MKTVMGMCALKEFVKELSRMVFAEMQGIAIKDMTAI
jgi:hypothetical protein